MNKKRMMNSDGLDAIYASAFHSNNSSAEQGHFAGLRAVRAHVAEIIGGEVEMRGEASDELILLSIKALCENWSIDNESDAPRSWIAHQLAHDDDPADIGW